MSFLTSPLPDVRNIGLRLTIRRTALNAGGWDMAFLDTALKALEDDNGNQVLPNGVLETVAEMRRVFEALPQIMEQAFSLYDIEYKKFVVTQPAAPPQTVTVQFTGASTFTPGDFAGDVLIQVSIITNDLQVLENEVEVDVRDLLTGSANNPFHYTMVTPQTLTFPPGSASGSTQDATLTNTGVNDAPDKTVNLDLDNAVGATEGAQNTHQVTIVNIGA